MSKLFFMQPILDFISTGKFFRTGFGWILRVLAVALLFGGFYLFIESWKAVEYLIDYRPGIFCCCCLDNFSNSF